MSKKALKGLVKTKHFKQRQKERKVSDQDVLRVLKKGELIDNDHGQNFKLGDLKVTVDHDHEVLITVHPGYPKAPPVKLLSKDEARKISEIIKEEVSIEADPFLEFVSKNKVKKLKE